MEQQRPILLEEILREILSYVLPISPHVFFLYRLGTRDYRAQREILHRNSQLLLVSKSWLRAGTPLLYKSLELSKQEHTSAVAKLFREHPDVGSVVRCLKVEGGIAEDLVHIARHTPNLRSLFISVRRQHCQDIAGLQHALPLFNPIDLYVDMQTGSIGPSSQNAMAARTLLFSHVADVWKSLHTVTLGPLSSLAITAEIQTALLNSSMKEFRCHVKDMEVCIRRGTMKIILEGGRVTRVTCFGVPAEAGMRNYLHEKGLSQHSHKFTFLPASMLWSKMERK